MKTQSKKLQFKKDSISELNDQQLTSVAGGGGSIGFSISFHQATSFYWPALSFIIDIE